MPGLLRRSRRLRTHDFTGSITRRFPVSSRALTSFETDWKKLVKGETSCAQLVSSFLRKIGRHNSAINAVISVSEGLSRDRALELDQAIAAGNRFADTRLLELGGLTERLEV